MAKEIRTGEIVALKKIRMDNKREGEWGDRSMLATIALGTAQGVASGAIAGHLVATSLSILGGAFVANYISEKLVGYLGGVLFLVFAIATFFGGF
ncbi:GDT1-like protein 2, chloroplastic [Capsicum galapagoense]